MTTPKNLFASRKLLVAAVGVATINYVAVACSSPATSGNLVAPRDEDASSQPDTAIPPTSGNLAPPPDAGLYDAADAADAADDADTDGGDAG